MIAAADQKVGPHKQGSATPGFDPANPRNCASIVKSSPSPALNLIKLRLLVGFLGEKRQANWWDCGFLDATGRRFLETTFPRTFFCAEIRSNTEAARVLHDARIGRVGVFHLFRLPVDHEDALEAHIADWPSKDALSWISSRDTALEELQRMDESHVSAPQGPVQVGVEKKILAPSSISDLAAHYRSAFAGNFQCFPYFAGESHG